MNPLDEARRINLADRAQQLGCLTRMGLTADELAVMEALVEMRLFSASGGGVVAYRLTADGELYLLGAGA